MSKRLESLMTRSRHLAAEQAEIQAEILGNTVDPQRIAFLIHQIQNKAVDHYILRQEIDDVRARSKKSWWERWNGR